MLVFAAAPAVLQRSCIAYSCFRCVRFSLSWFGGVIITKDMTIELILLAVIALPRGIDGCNSR